MPFSIVANRYLELTVLTAVHLIGSGRAVRFVGAFDSDVAPVGIGQRQGIVANVAVQIKLLRVGQPMHL